MSAWLVTWALRGALVLALLAGAYGLGRQHEADERDARQARQDAASAREMSAWVLARIQRAHTAALALAADRERIRVVYRPILQEIERATTAPDFRDCDIPPDSLRLLRAATEGPGEPAAP